MSIDRLPYGLLKSERICKMPNGVPEKESALAAYGTIYDTSHGLEPPGLPVNILASLCITGNTSSITVGPVPTGRKYPPMQKFILEEAIWAYTAVSAVPSIHSTPMMTGIGHC